MSEKRVTIQHPGEEERKEVSRRLAMLLAQSYGHPFRMFP